MLPSFCMKTLVVSIVVALCTPVAAQWVNYPTPGLPTRPDR